MPLQGCQGHDGLGEPEPAKAVLGEVEFSWAETRCLIEWPPAHQHRDLCLKQRPGPELQGRQTNGVPQDVTRRSLWMIGGCLQWICLGWAAALIAWCGSVCDATASQRDDVAACSYTVESRLSATGRQKIGGQLTMILKKDNDGIHAKH